MPTELSVVEQRYLAVREVLDGAKVTDVATRYGVDRRTVHRWLARYANEGLGALADRSCRTARCPHQIAPEIEARIVTLRTAHPGWGPRTIPSKLRREESLSGCSHISGGSVDGVTPAVESSFPDPRQHSRRGHQVHHASTGPEAVGPGRRRDED